jgi:hypothetical protein
MRQHQVKNNTGQHADAFHRYRARRPPERQTLVFVGETLFVNRQPFQLRYSRQFLVRIERWDHFSELDQKGLAMCGQMTAVVVTFDSGVQARDVLFWGTCFSMMIDNKWILTS